MVSLFSFVSVFLFGAVIGSFLNVIILRLNTGQSIIFGQSKCFSCAKKLRWYELLPIASFVFLKGKCASCKTKISWQYPVIETTTGLLFLLISNIKSQISNLDVIYYWIIFSLLIIIAAYDYRHQIIPNLVVWIFNGLAFLSLFFVLGGRFENFDLNGFLAGFILFAFFASLWAISRGRWMGFGDAKLALGIGWFLGLPKGAAAVTLAFWIGAIVGLLLLYFGKKRYNMKSAVAFGPFMILGAAVSFFLGEKIISFLL